MTAPYTPPPQINPIQLLSALAGIQQSRREMDLAEKTFEQKKEELALAHGLEAKSTEYKKFVDALQTYSDTSLEGRAALGDLGKVMGLNPQMQGLLQQFAANAPESLKALQQRAASQGYRNAQPQQQAQMNQEAATAAVTGMNQGQMQTSNVIGQMAGGPIPQGSAVTPSMQTDFAQNIANRQSPLQALIDRTIAANPDMRGRMASVQAGTGMTASTSGQIDVSRGGVEAEFARLREETRFHDMEIAERLATAKLTQNGQLTPTQRIEAIGKMIDLQKEIPNPKAAPEVRTTSKAIFNRLAYLVDAPELLYSSKEGDAADVAQRLQNMLNQVRGTPTNPSNPPPPATGPIMQQSNPMTAPPVNPLGPFVRPPQ